MGSGWGVAWALVFPVGQSPKLGAAAPDQVVSLLCFYTYFNSLVALIFIITLSKLFGSEGQNYSPWMVIIFPFTHLPDIVNERSEVHDDFAIFNCNRENHWKTAFHK